MKLMKLLPLAVLALVISSASFAQMDKEKTVEVGGAPMYPGKNIVENAVNSKDHTTLYGESDNKRRVSKKWRDTCN